MNKAIIFPHLGITLKNVGQSIDIHGFSIAYYGIIIGCAILIGIFIATREARRTEQNPENYMDLAMFAIVFAILGARAYYVIFSWNEYKDNLIEIIDIRQGGLAIYGGVIAAVITVLIFAKVKKLSAVKMLDTAVLGLVAGQMIGRWGNFFNREAFGGYTNGLFAMRLPITSVRISDITDQMREHIEVISGIRFIQVHPTFLYESIWCLLLFIFLLFMRKRKIFEGELFLIYLVGYGFGRFFIEGLRTDQLLLPKLGWPVSQALALFIVVVGGGILFVKIKTTIRMKRISLRIRKDVAEYQPEIRKEPKEDEEDTDSPVDED